MSKTIADDNKVIAAYTAVPQIEANARENERTEKIYQFERDVEDKPFMRYWLQYVIAISVSLTYMMNGNQAGWSGPTLVKLKEMESPITSSESSWLVSTYMLGYVIGPILGAFGGNILGRRKTILIAVLPTLFGTLLTASTRNIYLQCLGRAFCGLGIASASTIIPLYIGEISSPRIRGKLTCFLMMEYNLGLLLEYGVGGYTSVFVNGLILAAVPVVFLATFWWMPESPYFLVMKGDERTAIHELERLKITDSVMEELDAIKAFVKEQEVNKGTLSDIFLVPSNRKALFITMGITTANCFTGIYVILAYMQPIFDQVDAGISTNVSSMIFAVTGILITAVSSLFIDTWGRRPLLMLSTSCTAVTLFVLGTYFYLQHINYTHLASISLMPIIALVMVKFSLSLGVSTLQYVCMGELFPTNITSLAACVIETYTSIIRFAVVKSYQFFLDTFGIYYVFWGFGVCCVLSTVFVAVCVPETKNKTLEEIQYKLRGKQKFPRT